MEKDNYEPSKSPNKSHRQYSESIESKAQPKLNIIESTNDEKTTILKKSRPSPEGRKLSTGPLLQSMEKPSHPLNDVDGLGMSNEKSINEKSTHNPSHSPHRLETHLAPIEQKKIAINMEENEKPIPSPETSPQKRKTRLESIPALAKLSPDKNGTNSR